MPSDKYYRAAFEGRLPLIGTPIRQVKTPPHVNKILQKIGIDAEMVPIDIPDIEVDQFFSKLRRTKNAIGCSVTIPHKVRAYENMDGYTARAKRLGVVNTVRRESDGRLVGDMTDGIAMKRAACSTHTEIKGSTVLIVGAGGGAGRAIADAFAEAEATKMMLIDPDKTQLDLTLTILTTSFPKIEYLLSSQSQIFDIAINASPLGMSPTDDLPMHLDIVKSGGTICDAVTTDPQTKLIKLAQENGFKIVDGRKMAVYQIDKQMEHWKLDSNQTP